MKASKLTLALLAAALMVGISGDVVPLRQTPDIIVLPSGVASLERLSMLPGYRLTMKPRTGSGAFALHVPYPVYRFDAGDVNNDGSTDILLGVIKTTHFDPVLRRRLFVYRVTADGLTPLWLGSRVCQELVDFRPVREGTSTRVLTIEKERGGRYCIGLYVWHDFGLQLIGYSTTDASYDTAQHHFADARHSHPL